MTATEGALVLDGAAASRRDVVRDFWAHRSVLYVLARSDFQVRYKRASFGVLWAVAVPVLQAVVLAVVFANVLNVGSGRRYGVFVLAGVAAWSYFAGTIGTASTAIVDGSGLTDKVWFPRALLPVVPALSGLVGLAVTVAALVVTMPVLGAGLGVRVLLLIPACILLVVFTAALALVLSALHVYYRDVRFLVQAVLLVLFYLTPVAYQLHQVHRIAPLLEANPVTGVVTLFHVATVGAGGDPVARPLIVALASTLVLIVAAVEAYRRHDRLFVDQL